MSEPIVVKEYGQVPVRLTAEERAELLSVAGRHLSLAATSDPGTFVLSAGASVGTVVTPSVSVLITPKIPMRNLLYLLEAGGDPLDVRRELFDYDVTDSLLAAMATFYVHLLEQATVRGLYRSYQHQHEDLPVLRGRISIGGQLRAAGVATRIACEYDEYTADNLENQILLTALRVIGRLSGVPTATRQRATRLRLAFAEVDETDLPAEAVDRVVFTRLNRPLSPALRIAQVILRWSALAPATGGRRSSAFLVNMATVFEEFVEHRLRAALRGKLQVIGQYRTTLDENRSVSVRPDLVFVCDRAVIYVADAKYKLIRDDSGDAHTSGLARQADYYQLLAYCTALRLPEGLLIYAHDEGNPPPGQITVRHSGVRLKTARLPLGGTPAEIDAGIHRIAQGIICESRSSGRGAVQEAPQNLATARGS